MKDGMTALDIAASDSVRQLLEETKEQLDSNTKCRLRTAASPSAAYGDSAPPAKMMRQY